ncbi:MAG: WXG100 family type VII secretion target [Humibacillus sp.]|nr:WXG100 family type VII secretion target [Humibacillus sp.]MDN5778011.1 WXG100 family type VII secretion target [Humibacillus sp.]
MAIYKKGADPVALRASAGRITAHAHDCDSARNEASRAVRALNGEWSGGDLDHLLAQWPPIESQLTQVSTHLAKLAEALRRNATQQDSTSGPGSGSPGSGAPGPVGPLGPSPLGPGGNGDGPGGQTGGSLLGALGMGMAVAGSPGLVGQTAGVLATLSRTDGVLLSGRYLSNITEMARVGDPLFDLLPSASKFAGISNLAADAWSMKGLSGLFTEGSQVGSFVGKFGVLGPVGIGLSAAALGTSIVQGDTRGIIENGLGTGLAAGAVFAPPPINVACGIAGLGLVAYQNIPAVHETVDAIGEGIADVASGIGDAASDAWSSVTSIF